jgi:hypothetical protein
MTTTPRHWHITRDVKPRGECAACDLAWKIMDDSEWIRKHDPLESKDA